MTQITSARVSFIYGLSACLAYRVTPRRRLARVEPEKLERAARIELASSAWKAEVLPLHNARAPIIRIGGGGGDWIRTNVHIRDQIYSLAPLTTRPPLRP